MLIDYNSGYIGVNRGLILRGILLISHGHSVMRYVPSKDVFKKNCMTLKGLFSISESGRGLTNAPVAVTLETVLFF